MRGKNKASKGECGRHETWGCLEGCNICEPTASKLAHLKGPGTYAHIPRIPKTSLF